MRISKQRLRQILREELEIALLKEQFFDPNSSPGGTLFDQWRNVFSNASSAFTNAYNQSYNQATGATNPATNTGTTAATPPAEASNQQTGRFICTFYFEPDVTAQQITSANLTERLQQAEINTIMNADDNIITANLRSMYANAGYPPNYNWSQYINQLKQAARQLITVSAPRIEENDDKTVASYTIQKTYRGPLFEPNRAVEQSTTAAWRNFYDNLPEAVAPVKLIPTNRTPNNHNPDFQVAR